MKSVNPQQLYVTQWAYEDPVCLGRMRRLMQGFGLPESRVHGRSASARGRMKGAG